MTSWVQPVVFKVISIVQQMGGSRCYQQGIFTDAIPGVLLLCFVIGYLSKNLFWLHTRFVRLSVELLKISTMEQNM